ncbi:MarR family winged helix-turn-helix transcriptional regulator [Streptoalloteichus hindustanus]|uniref:MarR family protein n=1 Tax=Streptoalloteichus hindustanus TaxID=2017 RepID=A0A1M5D1Y1_STRHI|nr:MarR family transcriptional regulator [Streptoalloteichus hindustanus]SHF60827.1 MarR family protein [Streptoalloteichus hindustanus]
MDVGQLHRLGRRLVELSHQASCDSGELSLTTGEAAVLQDVISHPESSVSEIGDRTGFAQSHVSTCVARLRDRQLVTTATDPADRRRTRVRASDGTIVAVSQRGDHGVDGVLGAVVGDPDKARRVAALLDELAHLLLP